MRTAAGSNTKSAISHTYVVDTRDDRLVANRGFYLRVFQELAGAGVDIPLCAETTGKPGVTACVGLGGDSAFYKAETEAQISRQVADGLVGWISVISLFLVNLSSLCRSD
jgi:outer membrane protein insertion porin family